MTSGKVLLILVVGFGDDERDIDGCQWQWWHDFNVTYWFVSMKNNWEISSWRLGYWT